MRAWPPCTATSGRASLLEQYQQESLRFARPRQRTRTLYITAHYYTDTGQVAKGLASYQLYAQTYPRDGIPTTNLGVEYGEMGDFEKSLEYARRAMEINPDNYYAYAAAHRAYRALGRADEARAVMNAALQRNLGGASLHSAFASLALAQGDTATYQREEAIARKNPDEERGRIFAVDAGLAMQHGQLRRARELARQSADMARRAKLNEVAALWLAYHATLNAEFGSKSQAREDALAALAVSPGIDVTEGSGQHAGACRRGKARARLDGATQQRPSR